MSPKKVQICIDALTQVDVIGLLVGTTRLAGMVDEIGLGRVKMRFGKSSESKIPIQVKYCRTAVVQRNGGLSTSG